MSTHLFNGISDIIELLITKNYKWGIVTNKPSYLVKPIIKKLNFHHQPDCIVSGDTLSVKKPSPEPLLYASRQISCDPLLCAYIGDDIRDIIAAKAAGFLEALRPNFKDYIKSVLANAKMLAETLKNNGFKIYSDGTDTHLMLVDLRPYNVKGNLAAESLSRANITCNKNGIPFDAEKPMITSGIRLGTQAATTRGFGLNEFKTVGELITKTLKGLSENPTDNSKVENEVKNEVISLTSSFPIYKNL